MNIGLRLPSYGEACTYDRVIGNSRWLEEAGFNSVWARDQLSFHPHAFEGKGNNILEPFTMLAAIAALTKRIKLGTSTVVTYRHPLVTSALFGTLDFISGGRIIPGIGAGNGPSAFAAIGLPFEKRGKIVEEMLQILRLTWKQDDVSFHGEFYKFDRMTINPRPAGDTPILYGGMSKYAVQRAVKYCEGWLPSRVPFKILDPFMAHLRELEVKEKKEKPMIVAYSLVGSIDKDSSRAWNQIGVEKLIENQARLIKNSKWEGVSAETKEDLDGAVIAGSPQEFVDQLYRFQERGIDEILLEFRTTFAQWENTLELLAVHVLPHFKPAG